MVILGRRNRTLLRPKARDSKVPLWGISWAKLMASDQVTGSGCHSVQPRVLLLLRSQERGLHHWVVGCVRWCV